MQLLRNRYFARLLTLATIAALLWGSYVPPVTAQDGLFDEPAADDSLGESEQPATQEELRAQLNSQIDQAEQLLEQGNPAGALELLNKVLATFREPRALLNQGLCYKQLGANELAIQSFSTAYSLLASPNAQAMYPGLLEKSLLERGKLFLETGRARDAADDFGQVRGSNPTSAEANFWTGKAILRKVVSSVGATEQSAQTELISAAQALEKAISLDSNMGEAYLERARVLARLRMYDLSVTDLEQAARLLGANSDAGAELGVALTNRAQQELRLPNPDLNSVLADLRKGVESLDGYLKNATLGEKRLPWESIDQLQPQPERMFVAKLDAQILLAAELEGSAATEVYKSIITDADRLLSQDVNDEEKAQALYYRGMALRMQGDLNGAIDSISQAIDILQTLGVPYVEAYLRRGICYYHQNQRELALQDFQSAAATPGSFAYEPRAMFWQGIVLAEMGDLSSAVRAYTRAIATQPQYVPAIMNRGLAYLNLGRFDQAEEDFNVILRKDPSNADARRYRDLAAARK